MATRTLETTVEISGVLSPSLQQAINQAIDRLNAMNRQTSESTNSTQRFTNQINQEANSINSVVSEYTRSTSSLNNNNQASNNLANQITILNTEINIERSTLNSATQATSSFSSALDEAHNSSSQANEGFTIFKATLANLASNAISAASNAIKGLVSDVIELGRNFTSTMSEVQAISGASTEELEILTKTAREYGASTVFSAEESAQALKYMSLAGWDVNESVSALGGVLDLAASSGMELGAASDMVTDYLSAFSMSADQAGYFADILAKAQSASNTTAEALGEAYKNAAANLNAAGQDVETVTSLLEGMANQGLKGSEAGTALAAMMRDLTKNMKDGKIMIGDTAIEVADANGNYRDLTDTITEISKAIDGMGSAERALALKTTFTADSTKGLNLILNEGIGNIAEYEEALRESSGTAKEMADIMNDNLEGDLKQLSSAFDELKLKIYDKLQPVLRKLAQFATNTLIPAITNISDYIPQITIAITSLVGVIAALKWNSILSQISKIKGALSGIKLALGAINAPVLAVVAVITTLALAFKNLWDNTSGFKTFFISMWAKIKKSFNDFSKEFTDKINSLGYNFENIMDILKSAWDEFCNILAPIFKNAVKIIYSVLNTTFDIILNLVDVFSAILSGDWEGVWDGIVNIFSRAWDGIIDVFNIKSDTLIDVSNKILGLFGTDWETVWSKTPQPVKDAFVKIGESVFNIKDKIQESMPKIKETLSNLGENIVEGFLKAKNFVVSDAIPTIQNGWVKFSSKIKSISSVVIPKIKSGFNSLKNTISNSVIPVIQSKWEVFTTGVKEISNKVIPCIKIAFEDLKDFIVNTVVPVVLRAFNSIKDSIGPVIEFVKNNVIPTVQSIMSSVINAAKNGWEMLKAIFNELLPVIKVIGGAIIAAVVVAWEVIKATFEPIVNVIGSLFRNAWKVVKAVWNVASSYFKSLIDTLSNIFSAVKNILSGNFSEAWENIKNIFSTWGNYFSTVWESVKAIFSAGVSYIGDIFKNLWQVLVNIFEPVSTWVEEKIITPIMDSVKWLWDGICNAVEFGFELVKSIIISAFNIITAPFRTIWENCKDIVISTWNFIYDKISTIFGKIKDKVTTIFSAVRDKIKTIHDSIKNKIMTTWNEIKNKISEVWDDINTKITNTLEPIRNFMTNIWQEIVTRVVNAWDKIFTTISDKVSSAKSSVNDGFESIKSGIADKLNAAFDVVNNKFTQIANIIFDKIMWAKDRVWEAIEAIKSFFNFEWNLPSIKLPHFSIDGEFSISPPSVPSIGVEWYAKGGIMNRPTVFGMNGSNVMVGGEAGPEAILPLNTLWDKLYEIISELSTQEHSRSNSLSREASRLLLMDNFSLGSMATGTTTIIYDFSNFKWNPSINIEGNADEDNFMDNLMSHEYEFLDWLEDWVKAREISVYG